MKSFSINASDKDTAIFFKDYLTEKFKTLFEVELENDDNFLLLIISFLNNTEKSYKNFIYYFLILLLIIMRKKLNFIIEDEYFYFTKIDKNYIYTLYLELKNISF